MKRLTQVATIAAAVFAGIQLMYQTTGAGFSPAQIVYDVFVEAPDFPELDWPDFPDWPELPGGSGDGEWPDPPEGFGDGEWPDPPEGFGDGEWPDPPEGFGGG